MLRLKWDDLNNEAYQQVYNYYKGMIAFRMAHPALRMTSAEEVNAHVTNLPGLEFNVTGFHISPGANGEENSLVVIFNPRSTATTVSLPEGKWDVYVADTTAGTQIIGPEEGEVSVAPISAMVLVQGGEAPASEAAGEAAAGPVLPVAAFIAIAAAVFVIIRRKKK